MSTGEGWSSAPDADAGGEVHGHVSDVSGGQVAVGGRVFQIDAAQGSYVVINADSEVEVVRRPAPVLRPPPPFPGLVARTAELRRIRDALRSGLSVEVYGPGGIGKSALLRTASNSPLQDCTPDGVVAIPARLGTADTLSYVFDTCYVGTRRVVPRREELMTALAALRLTLVLDDTSLSREDIDAIRLALPSSLLLLAGVDQRVFDGVEGIALGGLTPDEGVDLVEAAVGRELTQRERTVGARVSEVLHGTPIELVRFASLVRADDGDLVSVARGFGVDAQPEDLLVAVQRSVSVEEQGVLAALAAFDASVGAGPVAAFSGHPDAGALLVELCQRGLVQGDDLQGWRVRDRTPAPPEDRQRAATVLTTWIRGRSVPEEVAGEIPAIASALHQARQDRRWVDAISLAATAERPLALAGRWSAWRDTLDAGLEAAHAVGDVASARFFDHQLEVIATADLEGPPSREQAHRVHITPSPQPTRAQPVPPSPRPRRGRVIAGVAALLVFVGLVVGAAFRLAGSEANGGTPTDTATNQPTTDETQTDPASTPPTGGPTAPPAAEPNLAVFTLADQPAELEVGQRAEFTVRVRNAPSTSRQVGPSDGGLLTVSMSGAAELVGGTPGCAAVSGGLRCELPDLAVERSTDVTVVILGREAGSGELRAVAQSVGTTSPPHTRTFTVSRGQCTVPSVLGKQVDVAVAEVERAGFAVELVPMEGGAAPEVVIDQSPRAGEEPGCGSTVRLAFSRLG